MTFIFILTINIALWVLIRTQKRYWLAIPLWTIIVLTFVSWRVYNDKKIDQTETAYWKSADDNKKMNESNSRGNENIYQELQASKNYVQKYNMTFLHSILLQTILTLIFQIVGYKKAEKRNIYKWTSIIFGVLTVLNLWFELMIGIVPIGGMIG